MNSRAVGAYLTRSVAVFVLILAGVLSGCALPQRGPSPLLYDFGARSPGATPAAPAAAALPALAVTVQATPAFDGNAMLYRLAYADGQQLRAYTQARWAMPPAELVQQRLREGLSGQFTVLRPGEDAPRVLQLELEEFSQVFDATDKSSGQLRLRATVRQRLPSGERMMAQRTVVVKRPAPSADAAGGVRALSTATDAAVDELAQWLRQWR
ncbi:MAG: ABC-type transport auxiliary lipoprotein family protein [Hylemonella sp.]|nr:ABC-type transport auxiliary lipoprotein family protein [Hylemonella sp.]MDP1938624.1 ABC-type transport auxiliary lipoprotein family protein [Hylemonella sp.]